MNNHIIVQFEPFDIQQQIMVYIDGKCVSHSYTTVDKIVDTVDALKIEYNINQIELYGYHDYLTRYKALMKTKFNDNNCKIDIIER